MSQVDEGRLHAWLDGALSPDEAAEIAALVRDDAAWAAAAAEARGLVANASRLVRALDDGVVGGVRGVRTNATAVSMRRETDRVYWWARRVVGVAAALLVAVVGRVALVRSDLGTVSEERAIAASVPAPPATADASPAAATTQAMAIPPAPTAAPARTSAAVPEVDREQLAEIVVARKGSSANASAVESAPPVAAELRAAQAPVAQAPAAARDEALPTAKSARMTSAIAGASAATDAAVGTPLSWLEDGVCARLRVSWTPEGNVPASRAEILQVLTALRVDGDSARFTVPMRSERRSATAADSLANVTVARATGRGTAQVVRSDETVVLRGQVLMTARCP